MSRWPALFRMATLLPAGGDALPNAIARYLVSSHPSRLQRRLVQTAIKASRRELAKFTTVDSYTRLSRSILVKAPVSPNERGILIVSFETELEKLVLSPSFAEVERLYQVVFLPTWQPAYSRALFLLAARATRPYYVMPASEDDLSLGSLLGELCVPLPFQASSWVAGGCYSDTPAKDIDILLLANFSKYKRHWRLFEALKDIPISTRVVIAGRPWGGRTADTLLREARAFGVEQRISIMQDLTDQEVACLLARARLFCALSHKEGSFIAVAEALMAGTPVAIFDNAIIGSKSFVRPETGFRLDPNSALGPQINDALSRAASLAPQKWARREIAAEIQVQRLTEEMRAVGKARGEWWSAPIAPFYCRNFIFDYLHVSDREAFAEHYRHLALTCGLAIVGFEAPVRPDNDTTHSRKAGG
jgi:glycosyltransferase involved in cell wall biosynthesis